MDSKKTILITGANRGLGLGLTKTFLERDYRVFATCRDPKNASELEKLKTSHPDALFIQEMDIAKAESVSKAYKAISDETSSLDILFNNAGIYGGSKGSSLGDLKEQELLNTFDVNCLGAFRVTRTFIPLVLKGEDKKLIHMSSLMGSIEDNTTGGSYPYRLSKAALNMLSRNFSWEFKDKGVTSVVFHPGWVKTDMGGKNAPLEIERSVTAMADLVEKITEKDSGSFLNYQGKQAPY